LEYWVKNEDNIILYIDIFLFPDYSIFPKFHYSSDIE